MTLSLPVTPDCCKRNNLLEATWPTGRTLLKATSHTRPTHTLPQQNTPPTLSTLRQCGCTSTAAVPPILPFFSHSYRAKRHGSQDGFGTCRSSAFTSTAVSSGMATSVGV